MPKTSRREVNFRCCQSLPAACETWKIISVPCDAILETACSFADMRVDGIVRHIPSKILCSRHISTNAHEFVTLFTYTSGVKLCLRSSRYSGPIHRLLREFTQQQLTELCHFSVKPKSSCIETSHSTVFIIILGRRSHTMRARFLTHRESLSLPITGRSSSPSEKGISSTPSLEILECSDVSLSSSLFHKAITSGGRALYERRRSQEAHLI